MNGLKKFINELSAKSGIINTVLGIVLIISLILIYFFPGNKYVILAACICGGLINIMNGIKVGKDPMRKMTGLTFLMMGMVLIVLGFLMIQYFMK